MNIKDATPALARSLSLFSHPLLNTYMNIYTKNHTRAVRCHHGVAVHDGGWEGRLRLLGLLFVFVFILVVGSVVVWVVGCGAHRPVRDVCLDLLNTIGPTLYEWGRACTDTEIEIERRREGKTHHDVLSQHAAGGLGQRHLYICVRVCDVDWSGGGWIDPVTSIPEGTHTQKRRWMDGWHSSKRPQHTHPHGLEGPRLRQHQAQGVVHCVVWFGWWML